MTDKLSLENININVVSIIVAGFVFLCTILPGVFYVAKTINYQEIINQRCLTIEHRLTETELAIETCKAKDSKNDIQFALIKKELENVSTTVNKILLKIE